MNASRSAKASFSASAIRCSARAFMASAGPLPRSNGSISFRICATASPPEEGGPMPQTR